MSTKHKWYQPVRRDLLSKHIISVELFHGALPYAILLGLDRLAGHCKNLNVESENVWAAGRLNEATNVPSQGRPPQPM